MSVKESSIQENTTEQDQKKECILSLLANEMERIQMEDLCLVIKERNSKVMQKLETSFLNS